MHSSPSIFRQPIWIGHRLIRDPSDPRPASNKNIFVRFWSLGVVLLAAFICGLAYHHSGWMEPMKALLVMVPIALVIVVAAFVIGVRRSRLGHPFYRIAIGLLWGTAAVALILLPAATRWVFLWERYRFIPKPADAYGIRQEIDVVRHNGHIDFKLRYATTTSIDELETLFQKRFAQEGWEFGQHHRLNYGMPISILSFSRYNPPYELGVHIEDGGFERRVQVISEIDPRFRHLEAWRYLAR